MDESGRDTNSPWEEAPAPSSEPTPSAPPAPIVLGGAEGMTLNTEMQGQMPSELAPVVGTTLTGSVGTIDSGVWEIQQAAKNDGSFWKGVGMTCLFGMAMVLLPMMLGIWSESRWDESWHQETLDIQWDAGGLNGTFQVKNAPIEDCGLSVYDSSGFRWDEGDGKFNAYADCDGRLVREKFFPVATYHGTEGSDGNFTLNVQDDYRVGSEIHLRISGWSQQNGQYMQIDLESQTVEEGQTEMVFFANESEWPSCNFDFNVVETNGNSVHKSYYYAYYGGWGYLSDCPDAEYGEYRNEVVGLFDTDSGYGDLMLNEPLKDGVVLEVEYWEDYGNDGGGFIYDIAPCFGFLLSLVLFGVWIQRIVVNFQAGKSKTGTGMLIGVIPAFFLVFVVGIGLAIMFNF
jgi:hypothetical protein